MSFVWPVILHNSSAGHRTYIQPKYRKVIREGDEEPEDGRSFSKALLVNGIFLYWNL